MPQKSSPGVYIAEVFSGNKPIAPATTTTAGVVGMTARGPINQPTLVTSYGEFSRVFGGFLDPQKYDKGRDALPYAVEGFFTNAGAHLYVVRVVGNNASEATLSLQAQGCLNNAANMQNTEAGQHAIRVFARHPGEWGNSLRVRLQPARLISTQVIASARQSESSVVLGSVSGLFLGSVVRIEDPLNSSKGFSRNVVGIDPVTNTVTFSQSHGQELMPHMTVQSQEFTLTVERIEQGETAESETFEHLSLVEKHPRYALRVIGSWHVATGTPMAEGGSNLIRLASLIDTDTPALTMKTEAGCFLVGGSDDIAGVTDKVYCGNPSDQAHQRTGVFALENEPALSIVAVPGQTSIRVQKALVEHCEHMRYRFAVLDTPIGADLSAARAHRQNFDSTRCAIYYPALERADSFGAPSDSRVISPSGHILGIYARTDTTRGVHKAPANEVVRGILAFDNVLDNAAQSILNPLNLNCFRDFRAQNRGLRVFGARVATSNPEYKYINVRRLILMIEQSLDIGLSWALFEANERQLWIRIKQSVTDFLTTLWRSGALQGQKAQEAFFVNIGYNMTMTQDDIDSGRLIVEIGVAAVKPAEFVIVKISQKTREAQG